MSKENLNLHVSDQGDYWNFQTFKKRKLCRLSHDVPVKVYLVCNHATECKKDGCKKRSAYTLSTVKDSGMKI